MWPATAGVLYVDVVPVHTGDVPVIAGAGCSSTVTLRVSDVEQFVPAVVIVTFTVWLPSVVH